MRRVYPDIPERMVLAGLSEGEAKVRRVRALRSCIEAPQAPWKWLRMRIGVERKGGYADVPSILSPVAAAQFIDKVMPEFSRATQEYVIVVVMDTRGRPLGLATIHLGTRNQSMVAPPDVLRPVILAAPATRFIVAHNHPSGEPTFSPDDLDLSKRLQAAAELVGLRMDDFLAITDTEVSSMAAKSQERWLPY